MARPQTALNAHGGVQKKISDQNKTALIYGKIRDGQYSDAVRLLLAELREYPKSRACLSLLGHCYYYMQVSLSKPDFALQEEDIVLDRVRLLTSLRQEFGAAANTYEEIVKHHPGVDEYRVYYAQSLYKAGMYDQALRACHAITDPQYSRKLALIQAAIKYELNDLVGCRSLIDESLPKSDPGQERIIIITIAFGEIRVTGLISPLFVDAATIDACISFKDDRFEDAITRLADAKNQIGYLPDISYNIALSYYKLGRSTGSPQTPSHS